MKSITPTINGLASSLFLNVGLVGMAEKLDPVSVHQRVSSRSGSSPLASPPCIPSAYTPRPGSTKESNA